MEQQRRILDAFADLFGYPDAGFADALSALLALPDAEMAARLTPLTACAAEGSARMEELYTATFDLQPLCSPYVAWQLCGESGGRTMFLLRLRDLYRRHGFDADDAELPDHLAVLLRFLARAPEAAGRREIVTDALLPALEKMGGGFEEAPRHPYGALLAALQGWLVKEFAPADQPVKEVTA